MKIDLNNFFTRQLLTWHPTISRPLPWKGVTNPYLIWLSEIILQQTRVEQGLPYYERFRSAYPTIDDMAKASEDEIMKLWEGLGYYSRAKNMHHSARYIAFQLKGKFPDNYEDILALKGVGRYTAAAIASFAFNLPYAVVDGNVFRVLSRFFGIDTPIDTTEGKKLFSALAQDLLDRKSPGAYNQAIMDFGAVQCTPKSPACGHCALAEECIARKTNMINQLPVKSKRIKKKERFFQYFLFNNGNSVLLRKRNRKDIWRGLYEFPLIESDKLITNERQLNEHDSDKQLFNGLNYSIQTISKPFRQTLTHQKIVATFWELKLNQDTFPEIEDAFWVKRGAISNFAFPKIIDLYLQDKALYLKLL